MDKLTQWIALTVVAVLAVLASGWFLLVSPERAEAEELRIAAEQQVSANDAARIQLSVLRAQAEDLPAQQAKLAEVAAKIPVDPALPALVRALVTASANTGVEFLSLTPSAPVGTAVAPDAAPVPTDGTIASPVPAATVPGGTLSRVPVSISVFGGFYQVEQYLAALEALPRALRVTNLQIAPGSNPVARVGAGVATDVADGTSLLVTIVGEVYLAGDGTTTGAVVAPGVPIAPPALPAAAVPAPTTTTSALSATPAR